MGYELCNEVCWEVDNDRYMENFSLMFLEDFS